MEANIWLDKAGEQNSQSNLISSCTEADKGGHQEGWTSAL